jgi:hypothetical protein
MTIHTTVHIYNFALHKKIFWTIFLLKNSPLQPLLVPVYLLIFIRMLIFFMEDFGCATKRTGCMQLLWGVCAENKKSGLSIKIPLPNMGQKLGIVLHSFT